MYPFMSREGKENMFSASKSGEECLKDTKSRHASSAVCARLRSAAHVTMTTTLKHN